MGLYEEQGTGLCLTVLPEREQRPLFVLHQFGRQLHRQPDDQHPQRGVQQEVHQVPFRQEGENHSETEGVIVVGRFMGV